MKRYSSFRPHMGMFHDLSPSDVFLLVIFFGITTVFTLWNLHTLSNAFAIETPLKQGELHEGIVGVPVHRNPLFATSPVEYDVSAILHAGLLQRQDTGTYTPQLAKEWQVDVNTYTLTLRDNAQFHDGTPVTAEDVLHTISMLQDVPDDVPIVAMWQGVSVAIEDSQTITITVPDGNLHFPEALTIPILPKHVWQKILPENRQGYKGSGVYIGAGPYQYQQETLTLDERITTIVFDSFSGYVLGEPYLERITFHFFITPAELIKAYANGGISALHSISPAESSALLRQYPTEQAEHAVRTDRVFGIFFNTEDGRILESPLLRSVVAQHLPRHEIVNQVFNNRADALWAPIATDTTDDELLVTLKELQQALEDIGWHFGKTDTFRERDGVPLRLSFVFPDIEEARQIAELIGAIWQQIGIHVETRALPESVLEEIIAEKQFDVLLHGYQADDPKDLVNVWKSSDRENLAVITSFGSPVLNTLLEELEQIEPPERYAEYPDSWQEMVYTAVKEEMRKGVPAVFLYSPHFLYILPSDIMGAEPSDMNLSWIVKPSDRFNRVHTWHTQKEKVWRLLVEY